MKWQALYINTVTNKVIASELPSLFKEVDICSQLHRFGMCFAVYTLATRSDLSQHVLIRVVIGTKCLKSF